MTQWFNTFKNWRFDDIEYSFPTRLPLSFTAPGGDTPTYSGKGICRGVGRGIMR